MAEQNQIDIQNRLLRSTEIAMWVAIICAPVVAWYMSFPAEIQKQLLYLEIGVSLFVIFFYHWIIPRYRQKTWVIYLGTGGTIIAIAYSAFLFNPFEINIEILYLAVIACVGLLAGKKYALQAAVLSTLFVIASTILGNNPSSGLVITLVIQVIVLLLAGYLVGVIAGLIHENIIHSSRKNHYLSTLLQIGTIASGTHDLELMLSQIAEIVVRYVPVTTCRIFLLCPQGDHLIAYGAHTIRPRENWQQEIGKECQLSELPILQLALETGKYQIIREDDTQVGKYNNECKDFLFKGVKTICVLPLISKDQKLGIIVVGEERHWDREQYYKEKLELLQTLATQTAVAIYSEQSLQEWQHQTQRLAVLNEVAHAIGSTIELDNLLELIYEQLRKVIPTDTYYVVLHDDMEDIFDFRILIDDGERFPPSRIPPGKGLVSWVIENRQPLLIRYLTQESEKLPVKPIVMGQERHSESWLGVPMLAGENLLGVLAIASYASNAFDEDDLVLLTNLASQAALALDNARQHAVVKEQARRDSLTGAYNHGHLLYLLNEEVNRGREENTPVSLIMLDIDYFKQYNDRHGHVIGDEVLRLLVKAIQAHVKKTDIVGRWGGEEFSIGLPGATIDQAYMVAKRVRETLAAVDLYDKNGQPIPNPTVSQGIATFPEHAQNTDQLVDVADIALYQAKKLGRDQVVIAE